jgi:multiple sugar transport system ATP-binding protein
MAKPVKSSGSSDVTLGVRPEDFLLSPTKTADSIFEAEIYVVEPLGANTVVDLKIGSEMLKIVTSGNFKGSVGQKLWVGFPDESVHVFDTSSGRAIV